MSKIVGADGEPVDSGKGKPDVKEFEYKAGGLAIQSPMIPNMLITKALMGAKQVAGQQAGAEMMAKVNSHALAQNAGQQAFDAMKDPFFIEPCAMAVFMYLAREVEYRDAVIKQLNERLIGLGAKPIDLKHPYPSEPPKVEPDAEKPDPGSVN